MARKLPSLTALKAFEAAGRHSSFSKAADEIFVTHAAVSRHIRDLELWLNGKLFTRTGRGVVLTELGQQYLSELTPAFDAMARATQRVLEQTSASRLKISVEEAFASRWLVSNLGTFTKNHQEIEIEIDPADEVIDFRTSDFDLAIRYGAKANAWPDTDADLLTDVWIFPVCAPDLEGVEDVKEPVDLLNHTLLHEDTKQYWESWLDTAGVSRPDVARGPKFQGHLALEAAEAGQGFALGDQILTDDALREGWLIKPLPSAEKFGAYYMVTPKGRPDSPTTAAFRQWLHAEIDETNTWFRGAFFS